MQVVSMGVQEVAQNSSSSAAACVRLANRLGYKGFTDLRMALAKEVFSSERPSEQTTTEKITEQTTTGELVHMVVSSTCESLSGIEEVVDAGALEASVEAILGASHVLIAGIGASGIVAYDFQQKLARLGLHAVYTADSDMQIVEACALRSEGVLIAISYSGESSSVLKVAREAKKNGATVIAITRIGGNSLSRQADYTLNVVNSESLFREGATLSRFAQLLVVDLIYTMILARRHTTVSALLKRSWEAVAHVSG
jgi:DNA-binding MurR/RpiR family transcriptional regulator